MTRRLLLVAATVAALCALGGCASSQAPIDASVATQLQSGVRAVAAASSTGNYALASSRLTTLQSELDHAVSGNQITAARTGQIQRIIDEVTADLVTLSTKVAPSPTPAPGKGHTHKPGHGKDNGND